MYAAKSANSPLLKHMAAMWGNPLGTKGALLYGVIPVCASCGANSLTHECPGCLASLRSEQGAAPLAPLCGYPCRPSVNPGGHFYPNLSGGHTHCQCKNHYPNWKLSGQPVNGSLPSFNTKCSSTKTALPTVRKVNGKNAPIGSLPVALLWRALLPR